MFHWFWLALILAVAAYFRIWNCTLSFFSLDTARDCWQGLRIATGTGFPLLGPGQQQAFHLGPLFYYVTSLSFLFSPSLLGPYVQVGIADTLSVLLCYFFTRRYFGRGPALLATALYAVCFEAVFVGRYPGNTGYVHLVVIGYVWLLLRFLETDSKKWMIASFLLLGLALQFHSAVIVLLPITFFLVALRFGRRAWKILAVCVLLVLVAQLPLIVYEVRNGFENVRSALSLVHREVGTGQGGGYLSRLAGALLLDPVAGAMLLPRAAVRSLQPFLLLGSLLVLFAAAAAIRGVRKGWWDDRYRMAVIALLVWVLFPLLLFPLYPRLNHNYVDVIHPGAMILIAAVCRSLRPRLRNFTAIAVLAVVGANLAFLVTMDELHTRPEGIIRLYRSSMVNLSNLKGFDHPLVESVPAGMQIRANRRLLELLGSKEGVLTRLHGAGRLLFLDENKRFILSRLASVEKTVRNGVTEGAAQSGRLPSGDHFYVLRSGDGPVQPGDIPLAGPWLIRRAVPCTGFIEDGTGRRTPTWAPVDPGKYELSIPRAVKLSGPLDLRVRPGDSPGKVPFRYVVLVSQADSAAPPVKCTVSLFSSTSMSSVGREIDSLLFVKGRILRVQCNPPCMDGIRVRIEGTPGEAVDIDVYGEPIL